jgi:hypothetical protein
MATSRKSRRIPWNKGKIVGRKAPLKLREIWAICVRLLLRPIRPTLQAAWPSSKAAFRAHGSCSSSRISHTGSTSGATWDGLAAKHTNDPAGELEAHMRWIGGGERLSRSNYRGCPHINVAAEFPEQDHPARQARCNFPTHIADSHRRISTLESPVCRGARMVLMHEWRLFIIAP